MLNHNLVFKDSLGLVHQTTAVLGKLFFLSFFLFYLPSFFFVLVFLSFSSFSFSCFLLFPAFLSPSYSSFFLPSSLSILSYFFLSLFIHSNFLFLFS